MQRGNQSMLTYVMAATTAFCSLGYARYFPETGDTFIPTDRYALRIPRPNRPWNALYGSYIPALFEVNSDDSLSVITQFAEKLVSETVDLDQDIVRVLGQKFWDLI